MATRGFGLLAELRLTVGKQCIGGSDGRKVGGLVGAAIGGDDSSTEQGVQVGSRWVSKQVGLGVGLKVGGPVHIRWESSWVLA